MPKDQWLSLGLSALNLARRPPPICQRCYFDLAKQPNSRNSISKVLQARQKRLYSSTGGATISIHQSSDRRLTESFFTSFVLRTKHNGAGQESFRYNSSTAVSYIQETSPTVITRAKRRKQEEQRVLEESIAHQIPPDASSQLSAISLTQPPTSIRRIVTSCLALSKPRLSLLMVLATAASYALYPTPSVLLSEVTSSPSLSALTLLYLTGGTMLCCASANSLNMYMEPQHDAKMSRTRNRPLVRGLISNRVALIFAATTAVLGVAGLYYGVNSTTAFLGGLNIVLYAGVYTPLKRISVINTWVGAIVGGIPPLMGWAAAAGQSATGNGDWQELLIGEQNLGGWLLAGLLFAWQFPHFNALSWTIREEYKNAGYRMLCWVNPRRNGRVALRYAILLFPICWGLTLTGVTDSGFLVTSTAVNVWVLSEALKFWRNEGHKGTARGLFWAGVWQLPLLMALAMFHKRGFWESMWKRITGEDDEEEDADFLLAEESIVQSQTTLTKVST